jgi:hypothetical protein
MRGSLHYAVHDRTVNGFGRDDDVLVVVQLVQNWTATRCFGGRQELQGEINSRDEIAHRGYFC